MSLVAQQGIHFRDHPVTKVVHLFVRTPRSKEVVLVPTETIANDGGETGPAIFDLAQQGPQDRRHGNMFGCSIQQLAFGIVHPPVLA